MNRFVDWQAGTCSFDTDEFKLILSFANTFPDEFDSTNFDFDEYQSDYRRVGQGQQLLANIAFASFDDIYYQFAAMDNDVCFVGYPGASDGLWLRLRAAGLDLHDDRLQRQGWRVGLYPLASVDGRTDAVASLPDAKIGL